jgi:hypothetical protein
MQVRLHAPPAHATSSHVDFPPPPAGGSEQVICAEPASTRSFAHDSSPLHETSQLAAVHFTSSHVFAPLHSILHRPDDAHSNVSQSSSLPHVTLQSLFGGQT